MPDYFRKLFRAKKPLDFFVPEKRLEYKTKGGYRGLDLQGDQKIMERFEEVDEAPK